MSYWTDTTQGWNGRESITVSHSNNFVPWWHSMSRHSLTPEQKLKQNRFEITLFILAALLNFYKRRRRRGYSDNPSRPPSGRARAPPSWLFHY